MIINTSVKKIAIALSSSMTIVGTFWINPSWAGDPFRSNDRREIGDNTEAAFIAFFQEGNYRQGKIYLDRAIKSEADEPLLWTLQAAYYYLQDDRESMKKYAVKIRETAKNLLDKDALRGNLYEGVAYFIEGAYAYETEGALSSVGKVQQALKEFDEAEEIDPNDPEYNLFKGYINLLLAVNLPFSSPEQSIVNFQKYAAPDYLVNRGIAVAYRDLKQYDSSLEYINKALENAPNNPELYYLKGQVLRILGTKKDDKELLQQALASFEQALSKSNQLPSSLSEPIQGEYAKTQARIAELN
jgi:tetratricopeptide (TPR) repeat protein